MEYTGQLLQMVNENIDSYIVNMENIAEKASSLFRRAEIFKDNFDKAIEELLDIKA